MATGWGALQAVDASNDKSPLIAVLNKKQPPLTICRHLADLLNRHNFCKRQNRGPKTVPSYERFETNSKFEAAIMEVTANDSLA